MPESHCASVVVQLLSVVFFFVHLLHVHGWLLFCFFLLFWCLVIQNAFPPNNGQCACAVPIAENRFLQWHVPYHPRTVSFFSLWHWQRASSQSKHRRAIQLSEKQICWPLYRVTLWQSVYYSSTSAQHMPCRMQSLHTDVDFACHNVDQRRSSETRSKCRRLKTMRYNNCEESRSNPSLFLPGNGLTFGNSELYCFIFHIFCFFRSPFPTNECHKRVDHACAFHARRSVMIFGAVQKDMILVSRGS